MRAAYWLSRGSAPLPRQPGPQWTPLVRHGQDTTQGRCRSYQGDYGCQGDPGCTNPTGGGPGGQGVPAESVSASTTVDHKCWAVYVLPSASYLTRCWVGTLLPTAAHTHTKGAMGIVWPWPDWHRASVSFIGGFPAGYSVCSMISKWSSWGALCYKHGGVGSAL